MVYQLPDIQTRKYKNLAHADTMMDIIKDLGNYHNEPFSEYDYFKKAQNYANRAMKSRLQSLAPVAPRPQAGGDLEKFINAISQQESGGNYGAVNSSSGALGRYQIMPSNVPSWAQEVLGYSVTPQQFLSSPQLQDQIARAKLQSYFNRYGPQGAASAWFSGRPTLYQTSGQVNDYVQSVLRRMGLS